MQYNVVVKWTEGETVSPNMHFKAAANYAAKVAENRANYRYQASGVKWDVDITVCAGTATLVTVSATGNVEYDLMVENDKSDSVYAEIMYIVQSLENAIAGVNAEWGSEATPTEIETLLGLKPGVVRKYIYDHREQLTKLGHVRYADKRTLLVKKGWAYGVWAARRQANG